MNGDLSVLVSTDTDFLTAIKASLELAPTRPILVACSIVAGRSRRRALCRVCSGSWHVAFTDRLGRLS